MTYTFEDIDKIEAFITWSDRKKIETLLEIDATLYTNLGKESTRGAKNEVKRKSKLIYKAIKRINHNEGELLLKCFDN